MNRNRFVYLALLIILLPIGSCKVWQSVNLYSLDDDIKLGQQVSQEIANNPAEYPVLPEKGNEQAYSYIRMITNKILSSGKVTNKDKFPWTVKIIKKDDVLNAFATPGGYIYVYTGLIKFLDSEDQLAGVLGHEIAHADRRHSTNMMTQMLGPSVVTQLLLGNTQLAQQAVETLTQLKFSRDHESEADKYSVIYLCGTDYVSNGAAGFFEKMKNQSSPPQFLSTHPNPANRVEDINKEAKALNCTGKNKGIDAYNKIKKML